MLPVRRSETEISRVRAGIQGELDKLVDQHNQDLVKFNEAKRKILLWTGRASAGAESAWPGAALLEGSWGRG